MLAPSRYLMSLALSGLAIAGALLALTLATDPYGMSPWRAWLAAPAEARPGRVDADRVIKPWDIILRQPRTIFLGSSRVKQTFDPEWLAGTPYAPGYNAGVDAVSPKELRLLLQHAIRHDANLGLAVIEIHAFQGGGKNDRDRFLGAEDWAAMPFRFFLSWSALAKSAEMIALRDAEAVFARQIRPDGRQSPLYPGSAGGRPAFYEGFINLWVRTQGKAFSFNHGQFAEFARMREACREAGIKCIFVATPIGPITLAAIELQGRWPDYDRWKRRLAALGDAYDFTSPDTPFWEDLERPMAYWADTGHFTAAAAGHMTRELLRFLAPDARSSAHAGREHDVDAQLAAIRAKVRSWIAASPEFAAAFCARLSGSGLRCAH